MNVRLMFPNEYLAAEDLQGKDVTLTIWKLSQEDLRTDRGKEKKWLLYFEELRGREIVKRLVLNKTNATTIAELHGPETDNWPGKQITLYPTTCEAFGENVSCIRVRGR